MAFPPGGNLAQCEHGPLGAYRGHTTSMLCTNQYQEIIQTEDDDLVGLRFAQPHGFTVQGFEVDLFVEKHDGHEEQYGPLINRIIQ